MLDFCGNKDGINEDVAITTMTLMKRGRGIHDTVVS